MRDHFLVYITIFLGLATSGCHFFREKTTAPSNGTFRWLMATAPFTPGGKCEAHFCAQHATLVGFPLNTLLASGRELQIRPGLAESFHYETPTRLVFQLRDNIRWSDGTPLTCDALLPSLASMVLNDANPDLSARLFSHVIHAKAFRLGKVGVKDLGIHCPAPSVLEFLFDRPVPLAPLFLAHPQSGEFLRTRPQPLGAPKSQRYQSSLGTFAPPTLGPLGVEYAPNPFASTRKLPFSRLIIESVASDDTRLERYFTHEASLVTAIPPLLYPQILREKGLQRIPLGVGIYLVFNSLDGRLKNAPLREALRTGFNQRELSDLGGPQYLPLDRMHCFNTIPINVVAFTADRAKQWLDDAKLADLKPLLLSMESTNHLSLAENLQIQWKKNVGIKTEIKSLLPPLVSSTSNLELVAARCNSLRPITAAQSLEREFAFPKLWHALADKAHSAPEWKLWVTAFAEMEDLLVNREVRLVPLVQTAELALLGQEWENLPLTSFLQWDFSALR